MSLLRTTLLTVVPCLVLFSSCLIYDEDLLEEEATTTSPGVGGAGVTTTGAGAAGGMGGATTTTTSTTTSTTSSTTTSTTTTTTTTTGGGPTGDPWINELHYDNVSADTGEGFEIAGPAGTDLSDFEVELYNGSTGNSYDVIPLSGVLTNMQNGYGVKWFALPANGIQNGDPDGLALVKTSGSVVVQFLSYEGTFTPIDGAASGMLSVDIGVAQDNDMTSATTTLQLTGTGGSYEDFTWMADVAESRDSVNTGQTLQ